MRSAPLLSLARAWSAVSIPPTATIVLSDWSSAFTQVSIWSALSLTGAPLSPPLPMCSISDGVVLRLSLEMVVLDVMIPSILRELIRSTISVIASLVRSGEILSRMGLAELRWVSVSRRVVSMSSRLSLSWRALSPGVLGLLTLTTK